MSGNGSSAETRPSSHIGEPLACVSCRSRKLKCDRVRPECSRCLKAGAECVYPESRRKPTVKRKNVKELEARLAQVEALLHEVGEDRQLEPTHDEIVEPAEPANFGFNVEEPLTGDVFLQGLDYSLPDASQSGFDPTAWNFAQDPNMANPHQQPMDPPWELMDLGGLTEGLPPLDLMEDLNRIFFERQQQFIPIIHPARYLQAFYSAPHMKPPMSLQYAIWALASNGHSKYKSYHGIFYQRARKYIDADEMKGYGEHFITISHAQAWCLIATDEAKSMMFTRAAMSCARAVRLAQMMGLHHLDCPPEEVAPTLVPPRDWAELEERRRVFWGIFCVDSHCSVSTGWPHLIDSSEVTTHLPSSEAAFQSGTGMETCSIHDTFKGAKYSSFASAIIACHLFNRIFRHVQGRKASDNPDNYEYGEYWERHRDIDNSISSAFMFLPETFRLPENYRDATAVHTNLNLHAAVICLHHGAIERIETYNLPEHVKKLSIDRLSMAAQEIVNIIKLTGHTASNAKSPLAALSLYCAASVYIYLSKVNDARSNITNLEFITFAMEAIGRNHAITRAFLRQVLLDIEHNDVRYAERIPRLDRMADELGAKVSNNIPLIARSRVSRHTDVQPPLPGRLPLGKPVGKIIGMEERQNFLGVWSFPGMRSATFNDRTETGSNKRRRTSHSTTEMNNATTSGNSELLWGSTIQDPILSTAPSSLSSRSMVDANQAQQSSSVPPPTTNTSMPGGSRSAYAPQMNIPHRTGSPAVTRHPDINLSPGEGPSATGNPSSQQQEEDNNNNDKNSNNDDDDDDDDNNTNKSLGVSLNSTLFERFGPRPFATRGRGAGSAVSARRADIGSWDSAGRCLYMQFLHSKAAEDEIADRESPWDMDADSSNAAAAAEAEAEVDWSLFATTGGSADVGGLGYGSVS